MNTKKLLGMVSPLYGAISGKGPMGDLTRLGAVGALSNQVRSAEEDEEEKQKRGGAPTYKRGGSAKTKKMAKGGSASSRADGIARKGKTRGKFV